MACAPARRIRCGSVARDARLAEITRARNIKQKLTTRMPIVQISGAGYEKVLKTPIIHGVPTLLFRLSSYLMSASRDVYRFGF